MKGLSLPINTTVIILVAILCLLALVIVIVFYNQQTPNYQAFYGIGCLNMIKDCSKNPSEITVKIGSNSYDLGTICQNLGMDANACKKSCGC